MAYRLKAGETVTDGVKRVILGEVDEAAGMLAADAEDRDEGIHDARKAFKKIRAALRLARPVLGGAYARENAWFRDSARRLSDLRDAQALLESFDKLRQTCAEEMEDDAFAGIRAALERRREEMARHDEDVAGNVGAVRADLADVRRRIESWALPDKGFSTIGRGLRETYRRGRRARVRAYRKGSDAAFHEWRKGVKYHWYQVRLLQELWPEVLKSRRAALKQLADILGDEHDLVVMKQTVATLDSELRESEDLAAFFALIERRQHQLRAAARSLGDRVYAETPKRLHRRFRAYWRAWRDEQARDPAVS